MNSTINKNRLHVIDAIRGFAIVVIMLLHNLEHFDVYYLPPNLPEWMVSLDKLVWDISFFLFAGKSYAMFALLFGLTFFIQLNNQEKRGKDFRGIFVWRLVLLFAFGIINSAFYQGDILTIYAILGFFLIPIAHLKSKTVFIIALILLLQPIEWYGLYQVLQNPNVELSDPASWAYFGKMDEYIKDDSFINTVKGNLTNGKIAVLKWSNENGRFLKILALFMLGMLAGRKNLFALNDQNNRIWKKILWYSALAFVPLYILQKNLETIIPNKAILRSVNTIENSWTNTAFMLFLLSGFVLLFQTNRFHKILHSFSPLGRMSLSNYIIQSIIGSSIYYGFGLGLYAVTGATYSMAISIILSILLGVFSTWWMNRHKRGPLETIWHKATWMFRKN